MIAKIEKLVAGDRKLKLRELADMVNISSERVYNILHNHLNMRKLCARWVPRVLTNDQKRERVECSEVNLSMIKRNRSEFFRRLITVDETWIHHYTPETAQQSKQWVSKGQSAPKRPKTQQSAGKVMATVFWDGRGIIHVDYLEHGRTITAQYYSDLLDRFDAVVKRKRPHLKKKKILFLQDNAPAHKAVKTMTKLIELGYEILPHPPYSPDLAPCDYYIFPNLKRWLAGKRFHSNEEVIAETDAYFGELDDDYYKKGIEMLEARYTRCIELEGDYIEE
jgi:[histone H3]-lysine36 N-dimethyltransferase SETMAR